MNIRNQTFLSLRQRMGTLLVVGLLAVAGWGSVTPAPLMAQTSADSSRATMLATIQAQILVLQAQIAALLQTRVIPQFTENLTLGSVGDEVHNLQRFLNLDNGTRVAISGNGSPGNETSYFGMLTRAAVMRFQTKFAADILFPLGLTNPTGFWGAASRLKANQLLLAMLPHPSPAATPTPTPTPTPSPTPTAGTALRVAFASPDSSLRAIPRNVSSANFGDFSLTADNGDVTVSAIAISRMGVGSRNDFDSVWLTLDGARITDPNSILSNDQATFTFGTPLRISRGSHTLSIMGSLSATVGAGSYNTLGIASINASVPIIGNLPLWSFQTVTSSVAATLVTMSAQGSDQTVLVGSSQSEIGRFQVAVGTSNSNRAVILDRISFENKGRLRNTDRSLANITLTAQGQMVSTNTIIDSGNGRVSFLFGPNGYRIASGQAISFSILANVLSADVGDSIQFSLMEASDLSAHEEGTGTGVRVLGVNASGSSSDPARSVTLHAYSVQTGSVNLSLRGASSQSVAPGTSNVVILDGNITNASAIRGDGFKVRLASGTQTGSGTVTDVNGSYRDLILKIDGLAVANAGSLSSVSGSSSFTVGASGDYYNFPTHFTLLGGSHQLTVEANVPSSATTGNKIKVQLFPGDIDGARYIATNDNVPSAQMTGQIQGALTTIERATVTVNRNDGFSNETRVGGTQGATLLRFTMDVNNASDVQVNSVSFRNNPSSSYASSNVTNMRLLVNGVPVGNPVDLGSGVFSTASFRIPRSGQVTVTLIANLAQVSSSATLTVDLRSVDASDMQGNAVSVTLPNATALSSSNPLTGATFTIGSSGSASLSLSGDSATENILLADNGTAWYPVVSYRLSAQDEDIILTDLYLKNAPSLTDLTSVSSSADARIKTIGVFDENGILKSSRTLTNGTVHFDLGTAVNANGTGAILISRNSSKRVTVKVQLNPIVSALDSGKLLRLVLDTSSGTGGSGIKAQGAATGIELTSSSIGAVNASSTAGEFFAIRKTKPLIVTSAQEGSETSLIGGLGVPIYRFSVTASGNGDMSWQGIKFSLVGRFGGSQLASTTGGSGTLVLDTPGGTAGFSTVGGGLANVSGFRLYQNGAEVQNGAYSVQVDWNATRNAGELAIVMNDSREEVIAAGGTRTYELRATIAGVTSSGDSLDVSLRSDANDARTAAYLVAGSDPSGVDGIADGLIRMTKNGGGTPYALLWSDYSGAPHLASYVISDPRSRDWSNDRFVSIGSLSWNRHRNF